MAVYLSPVGGAAAQFFTNNGVPLAGGKLYTYAAGTTTPAATYTSSSGVTAHTNPIVLDSGGRVSGGEVWLTENVSYKFILKDSTDVLIATYDNISGISTITLPIDSSTITYDPPFSGSASTNVEAKLAQTVSVKDFGAVGNGIANDTSAIQAALDTGYNVTGVSGETYYINPLTQSTARQVIDMRGCTLKLRPSQSSYMLTLSGAGAQVIGGVWDGNKAAGQSTTDAYYDHAAVNIAADYCVVTGIKSQNSAGIGIKSTGCNYALVSNNQVVDWNVQGIFIQSANADAYGNRIENNVVTVGQNTGVGVYITGQSSSPYTYKQKRWVVANNVVTGPTNPAATDIGITCRAVDGVVANNVVTNCDLGISADITSRTTFTGNRVEFTGTPATGYCLEVNGADNAITGNVCKGGKYGVVSSGTLSCDGNVISGNVFELQTINAIYFNTITGSNTARYLAITGNVFNFASAGAFRRAVYLTGDCRYSVISGNNFVGPGSGTANGRAIFFDAAYGNVQINANRFTGWERPVALYSASAYSYVNVSFTANDCTQDMPAESAWLSLEGSAAYGTGIQQLWNNSGATAGYSQINYIDRATNLQMLWSGNGSPEGAVTAAVGSLYLNTAGGAGTVLYVKQTGTGNTGWGAK